MFSFRLLALCMVCAGTALAAGAAEQRTRVGKAYDADSGGLIYVQRHVETVVKGRVARDDVTYLDVRGKAFAHKQVEFGARPYVPEFQFDDARSGHAEGVRRVEQGLIEVRYRAREEDPWQSAKLPVPDDALADAGFDRFIEEHWDELLAGTTFVRRFLVPSRLDFMDFRIRLETPREAEGAVAFALEVDSALLRLLVPPIIAVYDSTSRRLLRYDGLSNLHDEGGDHHRVRIDFEYTTTVARSAECVAELASSCVR